MILRFENEAELEQSFLTLIEIVINLREKTKDWHEHYGAPRAVIRKAWEAKADKYLEELKTKKKIVENENRCSDPDIRPIQDDSTVF